jgi:hypothetical protein
MSKFSAWMLDGGVLIAFALAGCGSSSSDDTPVTYTLYFSQDANASGLYEINTTNGVATIVGTGITGVTGTTNGLAYRTSAGKFLGSKPSGLLEINRDGSGFVNIGPSTQEALAYDDAAGILYGALNGVFTTINPATGGTLSTLAAPGGDVEGLSVDPATGNVYGLMSANPAQLMLYNKTGNTWSTIGSTGSAMDNTGLAYHPGTQTLYAYNNDGNVYSLNKTNGVATLVGASGLGAFGGGLTFARD